MEQDPSKLRRKSPSMYSKLSTGEFVMKEKDWKAWLNERHKHIEEATKGTKGDDEDHNEDDEEMEKRKT